MRMVIPITVGGIMIEISYRNFIPNRLRTNPSHTNIAGMIRTVPTIIHMLMLLGLNEFSVAIISIPSGTIIGQNSDLMRFKSVLIGPKPGNSA